MSGSDHDFVMMSVCNNSERSGSPLWALPGAGCGIARNDDASRSRAGVNDTKSLAFMTSSSYSNRPSLPPVGDWKELAVIVDGDSSTSTMASASSRLNDS